METSSDVEAAVTESRFHPSLAALQPSREDAKLSLTRTYSRYSAAQFAVPLLPCSVALCLKAGRIKPRVNSGET